MVAHYIFAHIRGGIIVNTIICDSLYQADRIGRIVHGKDTITIEVTQYPVSQGCTYKEGIFYDLNGIKVERIPNAEEQAQQALVEAKMVSEQLNPTINIKTCTLDEFKKFQINLSKKKLEEYLTNNSITSTCHGGVEKQYSITFEKTTLLTQMIKITEVAIQTDTPYQPSWNATGEACTYDWTINELYQLAFEIEIVVRPKISTQQHMEEAIKACVTKEEILVIDITF